MSIFSREPTIAGMIAAAIVASSSAFAQEGKPDIIVDGEQAAEDNIPATAEAVEGPEIEGVISARSGNRLQIMAEDGAMTIVNVTDATDIKASGGFLGLDRETLDAGSLLNGLPVTVKTMQADGALLASDIRLRGKDLKTANMIRTGTAQGFAEQTAATQALRGRMGDIDEYNIKGTTSVNFDIGKADLSPQGKAELCSTATAAQNMKNALLLVVGYTDSTGSDELNQRLSEKRAGRVVNHLQQACGWKPYRMLTPAGMAKADPLADNSTREGRAQNRRVAVNILVSKGLDGL